MADLRDEKLQILDMLDERRQLFLRTVDGLTDEQARLRPTFSDLSLAGLVKHCTLTEQEWAYFMRHGFDSEPLADIDYEKATREQWDLVEGETLEDVVGAFNETAAQTRVVVSGVDLDDSHELPPAPWYEEGQHWTNREVLLHILAELSQHAGHADFLREAIDGQRSMA